MIFNIISSDCRNGVKKELRVVEKMYVTLQVRPNFVQNKNNTA